MKKYSELGATPDVEVRSSWYQYAGEKTLEWQVDSDYAPRPQPGRARNKGRESEQDYYRFSLLPNTGAMSESQFKGYIKRLRSLRAEFQQFVDAEAGEGSSLTREYEFSRLAKNRDKRHLQFISKKAQAEANEKNKILRVPHATAGLSYTHAPPTQQFFHKTPVPGHRLQLSADMPDLGRHIVRARTSVGGFVCEETLHKNVPVQLTDFGTADGDPRTLRDSGRGKYKPTQFKVANPPKTVGKSPQSLDATKLSVVVQNLDSARIANPHILGSKEYIAHDEAAQMRARPSMSRALARSPRSLGVEGSVKESKQQESLASFVGNMLVKLGAVVESSGAENMEGGEKSSSS
jgi:hypothetical protein